MASLLGSFNPNLKREQLAKYKKKFGDENVALIQRSGLFFATKILIPFLVYVILYTGAIIGMNYAFENNPRTVAYAAIIGLIAVIMLFLFLNLKRLLDFLMDFIIVTPDQIVAYNQKGLRQRSNITIETVKIKSMNVSYRNWLFSVFNNGDIRFLSEGDAMSGGEIKALYVHKPQKIKDRIYEIIAQAERKHYSPHND